MVVVNRLNGSRESPGEVSSARVIWRCRAAVQALAPGGGGCGKTKLLTGAVTNEMSNWPSNDWTLPSGDMVTTPEAPSFPWFGVLIDPEKCTYPGCTACLMYCPAAGSIVEMPSGRSVVPPPLEAWRS